MRQTQSTISFHTQGVGLLEITTKVAQWLQSQQAQMGQITLFCRHTSASLTIQENADPDVQRDLVAFFDRLVPENLSCFQHTCEGADDMPAHVKSALTGVSLTVPVAAGRMLLGQWQGIYLCEHRRRPHRREVVLHFIGE
ncbi:MAG: YjbQ family protein [Magnetococcales bacterium]|nr:YjbQ family protein [Magnetococcales bacterium]MBF0583014.1 YjbQ family protein [Magnetococcales bacterium]